MRYGIFGDIHGNLEALQAVLNDMEQQGVTKVVCLGDIVGYGANPKECLDIIRELGCPVVKGNHDEETCENRHLREFNRSAAHAIMWTRDQLSEEDKNFLRNLRYFQYVDEFTIVHASLDSPSSWGYIFNEMDAAASFTYQTTQICFFGHTHVPHVFMRDSGLRGGFYSKIKISPRRKYMINAGGVGQPRDGDWRAAYAIYDTVEQTVTLRRVEYDIITAQKKILEAGLPPRLAERLAVGR